MIFANSTASFLTSTNYENTLEIRYSRSTMYTGSSGRAIRLPGNNNNLFGFSDVCTQAAEAKLSRPFSNCCCSYENSIQQSSILVCVPHVTPFFLPADSSTAVRITCTHLPGHGKTLYRPVHILGAYLDAPFDAAIHTYKYCCIPGTRYKSDTYAVGFVECISLY